MGSTNNNGGSGQIQRNEAVTIRLAGVVTQVLPNGNLVVSARQEFLVNHEFWCAGKPARSRGCKSTAVKE